MNDWRDTPEIQAAYDKVDLALTELVRSMWPEESDDLTVAWVVSLKQARANGEESYAFVPLAPIAQTDDVSLGLLRIATVRIEGGYRPKPTEED